MKRSKRVKPAINMEVIKDVSDVQQALMRIAAIDREITSLETELNADVDRLKGVAELKAAPHKAQKERLVNGLAAFVEYNADLFKTRRSIETPYGQVGLRKQVKLRPQSKRTWAMVLEDVKRLCFTEVLKVSDSLNKEALERWNAERLAVLGVERIETDEMWYATLQEAIK